MTDDNRNLRDDAKQEGNAPELLPCPFCGGPASMDLPDFHVRCDNDDCWVDVELAYPHSTEQYAARAWNKRAEDGQPVKNQPKQEGKHTPGQWFITERDLVHGEHQVLVRSHGFESFPNIVADVSETENQMANARLIARAPELLEENERLESVNAELLQALKDIVTHQGIVGGSMPSVTKTIAQKAIAKARGVN